jgi:hypothetical protein
LADGRLRVAIYVMDEEAAQAVSAVYSGLEGHPLSVIVSGEIVAY